MMMRQVREDIPELGGIGMMLITGFIGMLVVKKSSKLG